MRAKKHQNHDNSVNHNQPTAIQIYNNYLQKLPIKQLQNSDKYQNGLSGKNSQNHSHHLQQNGSLNQNSLNNGGGSVFQNAYISHSPQPNLNARTKKNNLMVYGYNGGVGGNVAGNNHGGNLMQLHHSETSNIMGTALNLKSQKSINGQPHQSSNKDNLLSIKKEKERISSLLNQNSSNLGKLVVPSSRNSKEDQQQSTNHTKTLVLSSQQQNHLQNLQNSGAQSANQQQQPSQQYFFFNQFYCSGSFQVQPSNIHELNSFLNSNHYYNVQDSFLEKKRIGTNLGVSNLIQRKIPGTQLEKNQEYLVSVQKGKDIKFQQNEDLKTIDTELRAANTQNYNGILTDPIDKHSKSVLAKNSNPITTGGGSRQGSGGHDFVDINQEVDDILNQVSQVNQVNNSFTDKKTIPTKWVLMNSKHVRNKSESKIGTRTNGTIPQAQNDLIRPIIKDNSFKLSNKSIDRIQQFPGVVERYSCKSRQGFIPNTKKTNQDAYIIQKEFANIRGCWFMGVFDGHGMNGHLVSDFCKRNIPLILSNLINGGNGIDPIQGLQSAQGKKRKVKGGSRHFLPPLVNQNTKKDPLSQHSFHAGVYDDQFTKAGEVTTANSMHEKLDNSRDSSQVQQWMTKDQTIRDTQIKEAFKIAQEKLEYGTKIDCMFSGTTAVALLIHNNTVICANSGDSRAILCSQNQAGIWSFLPLSRDHKPDEADEATRVRKNNGRIEQSRLMPGQPGYGQGLSSYQANQPQFFGPKRVWLKHKQVPGLAMTRSMGDLVAKSVGVTYEPEIKSIQNLNSNDKFIVIASDGLWDRIPNDEVTRLIANPYYDRGDPEGAVQFLVKEAADRWSREQGMIDDITIIIAFINTGQSNPQVAAYFPDNSPSGGGLNSSNNH